MINIIITSNMTIGLIVFLIVLFYILLQKTYPFFIDEIDGLYITLGLLYSLIIIIHGWRLDPILLFSQVLIIFLFALAVYQKFYLRLLIFRIYTKKIPSNQEKEENFKLFLKRKQSLKNKDNPNLNFKKKNLKFSSLDKKSNI